MNGAASPLEGGAVTVTGGNGFLGREVCRELQRRGVSPAAPTSREYDLTIQDQVRALCADTRPDVLIHAAAAAGGIGANVTNPGRFLYENAVMGLLLLEEARRHGVRKFVLVSTTCAYPGEAPLPLREEALAEGRPAEATRPYGMAKRLLHEACRSYRTQYGLECAVVVPANLYGPGDHFEEERSHVVAALVRRFVEAERRGDPEVVNWGSGSATRELLYVTDAARGIVLAAETLDEPLPVNLGTGVETSIRALSELIAGAVGYEGRVRWDTSRPEGQARRVLDVSRARELLGFRAQVPLAQGIAETVRWYREHHAS